MVRSWIAALAAAGCLAAGPVAAGDKTDVRCLSYGTGFVYSESTGFCVRISGSIEAGFAAGSNGSRLRDKGDLRFDARKDTNAGPFRLYVAPKASAFD